MSDTIPLNKLILSTRNVRKTPAPDADIEAMAASIKSKGLLQNLVVSKGADGKVWEVDAGGCRLRALELLASRKEIARNFPVPVIVIETSDATEASLAENQRIPMNPADEVQAFLAVLESYEDAGITDRAERVANLAKRYGRTVQFVEQRLRLADLAPDIFTALREGRINLDAAKAYAAYPDHKLQMRIFAAEEKKSAEWAHAPRAIREAMKGKVYSLDHPAVVYVGLDAYRAAGGRVAMELFMGAEDRDVVLDPDIIDRLFARRAAADATAFAQEEGWLDGAVKPVRDPVWRDVPAPKGFRRVWKSRDTLTEEQRERSVAPFRLAADGSTLEPLDYYFEPVEPAAEGESRPHYGYTPETAEQRAARERAEAIEHHALRIAAPKVAGTPLEGRAFWPHRYQSYVDAVEQDADGDYVVALLVRIPAADLAAVQAEAEAAYERELAELAEQEAAEEAEEAARAEADLEAIGDDAPDAAEPAEIEEADA